MKEDEINELRKGDVLHRAIIVEGIEDGQKPRIIVERYEVRTAVKGAKVKPAKITVRRTCIGNLATGIAKGNRGLQHLSRYELARYALTAKGAVRTLLAFKVAAVERAKGELDHAVRDLDEANEAAEVELKAMHGVGES